ncbi:hypothetical protein SDC9_160283 [bioreactor metagenome]|uniref:NAD-specific glutamate dehydrogenase n=1 Tax=bioreactor metagenome TaxID=1076179 RepID=A0A645FL79_9ZZZZ
MDACGACFLRKAGNLLFDLLANHHHQVGQLVDDDHDVRHGLQRLRRFRGQGERIGDVLPLFLRILDLGIEAGNIAHPHRRHQLVALFHLGDAPVQRVGRLLHVGDDRRQQVRNALVDRQFQHLRVDHDQAHLIRLGLVEHGKNHRIDTDRLA